MTMNRSVDRRSNRAVRRIGRNAKSRWMARSSARRTNLCYECGRKRPQQIARVRLGVELARMLLGRNDGRHAVMGCPEKQA